MKKLFLPLVITFFTMSSFTTEVKPEEVLNTDCASQAWYLGTLVCNLLPRGCSDRQIYVITDNAYQNCVNQQ